MWKRAFLNIQNKMWVFDNNIFRVVFRCSSFNAFKWSVWLIIFFFETYINNSNFLRRNVFRLLNKKFWKSVTDHPDCKILFSIPKENIIRFRNRPFPYFVTSYFWREGGGRGPFSYFSGQKFFVTTKNEK